MLLHDSRRAARASADGELVLLDDQDRALWNRAQIAEGAGAGRARAAARPLGPYALQAAIAAVHAAARDRRGDRLAADRRRSTTAAARSARRRWSSSTAPSPSPARRPGSRPRADRRAARRGDLGDYHLAHSARADLLRRLGRTAEARAAYERALDSHQQEPERRFLRGRSGAGRTDPARVRRQFNCGIPPVCLYWLRSPQH